MEAIALQDEDYAEIDLDICIRCGTCHGVCPEEAVRHDGELVSGEIEAKIARVKEAMAKCDAHFGEKNDGQACLERWLKFFNKERKVMEQTVGMLESLRSA